MSRILGGVLLCSAISYGLFSRRWDSSSDGYTLWPRRDETGGNKQRKA